MVDPRFHTPRDLSRPTLGGKVARLAAAMQTPLMPWQRLAADVALEILPNGRFAYKRVIITVPRQSGKTTMTLLVGGHRTLTTPEGKIWYTAQTGQSARERFISDLVPPMRDLMAGAVTVKRGAGDTRLQFPALGSQFRPHPPNDEYLHGEQSDLNLVDEPWAFTEAQGLGLVQAFLPTQNTRPNAQTFYLSTMGDADSVWWHSLVDEARTGADPRTCIIDYGLDESRDPDDVDAVIAAHPAVGHTIEPEVIRAAHAAMPPAEFARAYANIRTSTRVAVFDPETVARVLDAEATIADDSPVSFGAAVSWDRSRAVIAAAGRDLSGRIVCEIIDARPGYRWAVDELQRLEVDHRPRVMLVDARSPASTIATAPELADTITIPDARAVASGTAGFMDLVTAGTIGLRYDAEVARAFDVLATRVVGELGTMFDRRHSAGSIAHLEAMMLAVAGLTQAPAPAPSPMIWTGDLS